MFEEIEYIKHTSNLNFVGSNLLFSRLRKIIQISAVLQDPETPNSLSFYVYLHKGSAGGYTESAIIL